MGDYGFGKVKPEFKALIEPLSASEYKLLTESMIDEAQRDPILTWHGFIIDGHHRKQIAEENPEIITQLAYEEYPPLQDATESEVMLWMIKNQLGRRNLTPIQKVGKYAEKMIELETIVAKERQGRRTDLEENADIPLNWGESKKGEVSDIVAGNIGVGRATIDRFKYVLKHAPMLNDQIKAGTMAIDEAYKIAKKVAAIEDPVEKVHEVEALTTPEGKEQRRKERATERKAKVQAKVEEIAKQNRALTDSLEAKGIEPTEIEVPEKQAPGEKRNASSVNFDDVKIPTEDKFKFTLPLITIVANDNPLRGILGDEYNRIRQMFNTDYIPETMQEALKNIRSVKKVLTLLIGDANQTEIDIQSAIADIESK